ncbi:ER membrane glycoprotein subunit of the GPI transamidase complex-like protein, partial [Steccherinum ochraceum]
MSGLRLSEVEQAHVRQLRILSVIAYILTVLLVYLASFLPLFDASPHLLVDKDSLASPLLRWDAFHFGSYAVAGRYVYEHQWAFFPGVSIVMKTFGSLIHHLCGLVGYEQTPTLTWSTLLLGGATACLLTSTTTTLYKLTLLYTRSPSIAYLTALLSLVPTSPVTLRLVPYSEPFVAYFSYTGMYFCATSEWFWAATFFTFASAFRSNGFLLGGFLLWGLLVEPMLQRKKIPITQALKAILYTALPFIPFIHHEVSAYLAFCAPTSAPTLAPWCTNFPPSIYTYVQGKYWNVGFLRYWTLAQIPNFVIAAPVLALLVWYTGTHIRRVAIPQFLAYFDAPPPHSNPNPKLNPQTSPLLSPTLTPHAIHALLTTLIYIFASHTQIVLRQAAALPTTYWAAAYLVVEKPG